MIRYCNEDDAKELREILPDNMTAEQMWRLVKFAKHVRGRCRNNSAFNNYMNSMFGDEFIFAEVPKEGPSGTYKGLRITRRDTGESSDGHEED